MARPGCLMTAWRMASNKLLDAVAHAASIFCLDEDEANGNTREIPIINHSNGGGVHPRAMVVPEIPPPIPPPPTSSEPSGHLPPESPPPRPPLPEEARIPARPPAPSVQHPPSSGGRGGSGSAVGGGGGGRYGGGGTLSGGGADTDDEEGLFTSEPDGDRPIRVAAHGLYQEVKQVRYKFL